MFSLMKLTMALKELKIDASLYPITFDSLICRARNGAVAFFMSGDFTHLLFLDADIEFSVEDILKLFNAKEKIIGGAYAQKWLNFEKMKTLFAKSELPERPMGLCTNHSVHPKVKDGVVADKIEVEYLTTGFMLIERSVIETMIKTYPERQFVNDVDGYCGAKLECFYNFFSVEINPTTKRYESEDYCFCRLWSHTGGKVYVIPDITLIHYGWFGYETNMKRQMEYTNSLTITS